MNRAQKHFSPNCTASIRNPLSVSVLTFRHLSLLMPPLVCEMIFTRKGPNEGKGRGFSKPVLQSKTGLSIACGLCCIILLLASRSYSQNCLNGKTILRHRWLLRTVSSSAESHLTKKISINSAIKKMPLWCGKFEAWKKLLQIGRPY